MIIWSGTRFPRVVNDLRRIDMITIFLYHQREVFAITHSQMYEKFKVLKYMLPPEVKPANSQFDDFRGQLACTPVLHGIAIYEIKLIRLPARSMQEKHFYIVSVWYRRCF